MPIYCVTHPDGEERYIIGENETRVMSKYFAEDGLTIKKVDGVPTYEKPPPVSRDAFTPDPVPRVQRNDAARLVIARICTRISPVHLI